MWNKQAELLRLSTDFIGLYHTRLFNHRKPHIIDAAKLIKPRVSLYPAMEFII